MRICILGHRGMLGHAVCRYLAEAGHEVRTLKERFDGKAQAFVNRINDLNPQWCVNCIGLIRPSPQTSPTLLDAVNHRLPAACSQHLNPNCGLIHPSTDCVFSPLSGPCLWNKPPNAADAYGTSKRLAEKALQRKNDFIIRCSIIGPEQKTQKNLHAWLSAQTGKVPGYTNYLWNGLTTLEWAKCCDSILRGTCKTKQRIIQPAFTPAISKSQLLQAMANCWEWNVSIIPIKTNNPVNRYLIPNLPTANIQTLLAELKDWYQQSSPSQKTLAKRLIQPLNSPPTKTKNRTDEKPNNKTDPAL